MGGHSTYTRLWLLKGHLPPESTLHSTPGCTWEDEEHRQEYLFHEKPGNCFLPVFWSWSLHLPKTLLITTTTLITSRCGQFQPPSGKDCTWGKRYFWLYLRAMTHKEHTCATKEKHCCPLKLGQDDKSVRMTRPSQETCELVTPASCSSTISYLCGELWQFSPFPGALTGMWQAVLLHVSR